MLEPRRNGLEVNKGVVKDYGATNSDTLVNLSTIPGASVSDALNFITTTSSKQLNVLLDTWVEEPIQIQGVTAYSAIINHNFNNSNIIASFYEFSSGELIEVNSIDNIDDNNVKITILSDPLDINAVLLGNLENAALDVGFLCCKTLSANVNLIEPAVVTIPFSINTIQHEDNLGLSISSGVFTNLVNKSKYLVSANIVVDGNVQLTTLKTKIKASNNKGTVTDSRYFNEITEKTYINIQATITLDTSDSFYVEFSSLSSIVTTDLFIDNTSIITILKI